MEMPHILKIVFAKIVLHVQMNEFPEGHVKVPSWELFILHIAVRF